MAIPNLTDHVFSPRNPRPHLDTDGPAQAPPLRRVARRSARLKLEGKHRHVRVGKAHDRRSRRRPFVLRRAELRPQIFLGSRCDVIAEVEQWPHLRQHPRRLHRRRFAREPQSDKAGAAEVFTTLARDYGYAQWQSAANPGEWIKAAELAEQRLAGLQSDTP